MALLYSVVFFLIALQSTFNFTSGSPIKTVLMPESCKGKTYCFNPENYPVELVHKLLKRNSFNLTVIVPVINQRGEFDEENFIDMGCKKSSSRMPIYYIVDEHDDVRVVLQSDKLFLQILPIQECEIGELKNGPSEAFTQGELENLNLRCENIILKYNFLVLSKDFNSIELVQNKGGLPVDCVCRAY